LSNRQFSVQTHNDGPINSAEERHALSTCTVFVLCTGKISSSLGEGQNQIRVVLCRLAITGLR
jgi:hypothetical protein